MRGDCSGKLELVLCQRMSWAWFFFVCLHAGSEKGGRLEHIAAEKNRDSSRFTKHESCPLSLPQGQKNRGNYPAFLVRPVCVRVLLFGCLFGCLFVSVYHAFLWSSVIFSICQLVCAPFPIFLSDHRKVQKDNKGVTCPYVL